MATNDNATPVDSISSLMDSFNSQDVPDTVDECEKCGEMFANKVMFG